MKADIHPAYNEIKVTCSCGNTFTTQSTYKGDLHIEVCSLCHPFYSGKQKILDTAGQVDKYNRKYRDELDGERRENIRKKTEKVLNEINCQKIKSGLGFAKDFPPDECDEKLIDKWSTKDKDERKKERDRLESARIAEKAAIKFY